MTKDTYRRAAALFCAVATLTLGMAPASATGQGADTCPAGYVCGWENRTYTGNHLTDADHIYDYRTVTWDGALSGPQANDKLSSVTNRFRRCKVRYYWNTGTTVGNPSMLFSRPALGGQYQDPNLSNGGPGTEGTNWEDKISQHIEEQCV